MGFHIVYNNTKFLGVGIAQSVECPSNGQDGRVIVLDFRKVASINPKSL